MVSCWAAEFRRGRRSLQDEAVSGENYRVVENIVLQNRRVSVQLIADSLGISTG